MLGLAIKIINELASVTVGIGLHESVIYDKNKLSNCSPKIMYYIIQ